MIRLIEDIVPPDRPEETPPPKWERVVRPVETTERFAKSDRKDGDHIHHEIPVEEAVGSTASGDVYIDERPPFVSRIPPREENPNTFLDRKPKERAPLSEETVSRWGGGGDEGGKGRMLITAGVIVFVLAYIGLSLSFLKATVDVSPKEEHVVLNSHLTASQSDPNKLPFTVLTLMATETKDIAAQGTKSVTTKASGKIIIYNEYGAKSQRLIKNTRFQATNGKIYRIAESVNVPGVTTVSGKQVPGRVEVTVYADGAGADFNMALSDFTIPGLKGDPRFQKIYARSKTPMTGGFSGSMKTVSDDDLAKARQEIESTLKTRLENQAKESVPKDYVMYQEGMYFVTRPIERKDIEGTDSQVRLQEEAMLHVMMFPRGRLAQEIAKDAIPNYDDAPVTIPDLDALHATITPKGDGDAWTQKDFLLSLTGDTQIIWTIDQEALSAALLGKSKGDFNAILDKFPSIAEGKAAFRPFWWPGKFPSSASRLNIVVSTP